MPPAHNLLASLTMRITVPHFETLSLPNATRFCADAYGGILAGQYMPRPLFQMPKQTPAEKLAALQEQMKAAKNEMKLDQQKRWQCIGEVVDRLIKSDAEFKAAALPKLQKEAENPREKEAVFALSA